MKRIMSLALSLLVAVVASAAEPVSVKAGKPTVFNASEPCFFETDFQSACVVSDGGETSFSEYQMKRGTNFLLEWKDENTTAMKQFTTQLGKKLKRGLQYTAIKADAKYKMVLNVERLDLGKTSVASVVTISGTLDVIDVAANKYVCRLAVADCKGAADAKEAQRLANLYTALANNIYMVAKGKKGAVEYCGDVENMVRKMTEKEAHAAMLGSAIESRAKSAPLARPMGDDRDGLLKRGAGLKRKNNLEKKNDNEPVQIRTRQIQ